MFFASLNVWRFVCSLGDQHLNNKWLKTFWRAPAFGSYLIAELPQAPCLSVRMFTIFWTSCVAVTWSRYLAARIRWSHIFSSSRFSAAYWAQLDWGGTRQTNASHSLQGLCAQKQMCQKGQTGRKIDCKMWNVGVLTLRHTENRREGKSNAELAAFSHTETSNVKHEGHFCPGVKLINNSRHVFTNALRHIKSHHTHNAQGGHFSLSEFVIRTGLWTLRRGESVAPWENKSATVKQSCDFWISESTWKTNLWLTWRKRRQQGQVKQGKCANVFHSLIWAETKCLQNTQRNDASSAQC